MGSSPGDAERVLEPADDAEEVAPEDGQVEPVLVAEVVVEHPLVHPGAGDDLLHPRAAQAVGGELLLGGREDAARAYRRRQPAAAASAAFLRGAAGRFAAAVAGFAAIAAGFAARTCLRTAMVSKHLLTPPRPSTLPAEIASGARVDYDPVDPRRGAGRGGTMRRALAMGLLACVGVVAAACGKDEGGGDKATTAAATAAPAPTTTAVCEGRGDGGAH